ncbi:glycine zipper 2TM domain-containing protein [Noviherbaspirillum pedocola]|uniref:Glycine zipper 2TM domain-containing protein n=1 Tax=Noviherbaspirillum pedocola TaxID=2801341 RepID=A0A934VZG9_9BURK|nr:glycine zipper 2TM domain-containing protein [Noviherbaspirillum pedocola]MBK4733001.1 glycine zipper 2TM domain-containing protein [Noviherbaspirillum pedocola]
MEMNQASNRIHPLVAGAAASVMLVSLVGVAAITGLLPSSHGTVAEHVPVATQQAAVANIPAQAQQTAPVVVREVVEHRTVVHDQYVQHATAPRHTHATQYAQYDSTPRYAPAPVYQRPAPAASNSPVGIGVGAVVGGLLGSQVGGGTGKTLATIAGAVGGGYVGNEVAKRNF